MIAPQAAGKRNEIARMLMLGAGQRPMPQQPMMPVAQTPMAAPQAVPYKEAGFGYNDRLTPLEEIGMVTARLK